MTWEPGDYRYETPTASPFEDISQYIPLLLAAVDLSLDRPDVWPEGDESTAQGYMEDLKAWLTEILDMYQLPAPGAMGNVPQSDGTQWLSSLPEFWNLVAKTAAAASTPLTVKGEASQSADLVKIQNSAGTDLVNVGSTGKVDIVAPYEDGGQLRIGYRRTQGEQYAQVTARHYDLDQEFVLIYGKSTSSSNEITIGGGLNTSYVANSITLGTGANRLSTGISYGIHLNSSANVGIGTNSPAVKLDINSNTMRLRTARTPASAAAAGNAGDICWDSNYVYICVATNTWKRVAIGTW